MRRKGKLWRIPCVGDAEVVCDVMQKLVVVNGKGYSKLCMRRCFGVTGVMGRKEQWVPYGRGCVKQELCLKRGGKREGTKP